MSRAIEVVERAYADAEADIRRVRDQVFVREQRISAALVHDARDPDCRHVLAFCDGELAGVGRLDPGLEAKVGRVAVLAEFRGTGVGRRLMAALEAAAVADGFASVWCHAQRSAVPFYLRLGYRAEGDEFLEAGIPHRLMRRELGPATELRSEP